MKDIEVKNLKETLSASLDRKIEIIQSRQTLLTPAGEHYGSTMLAIALTIKKPDLDEEEQLDLVAKLIPSSEVLRDMFDVQVTFKKEIAAYLDAIPAMIEMQREYKVPESKIMDIFPKCFGARINLNGSEEVDEDAALIFENLKSQGYDIADRFVGFDRAHAEMIVKDLAKFHAIPIAIRLLKPEVFKSKIQPCMVRNGSFDLVPEEVGNAFHNSIMDGARQVPELEPYLSRIEKVIDNAMDGIINWKPPKELFATIVHADYWVNNTMVLTSPTGKPIKNKIVDLQLMRYESCARDLIFFLFTSVINSVLDDHFDELIKSYHDTFIDYLNDFNVDTKPYDWKAFLNEVEYIGPREFYHVAFMLKPILTEKGKVKTLENFKSSDWCREDLLGDAHKRKLKDTVLAFVKRNWI